ncbi:MAG: hypothetical protein HKN68_11885 [Saprospiraceae bacterium]|nr:hypothetical protein [Saprospiraceae bacterium]
MNIEKQQYLEQALEWVSRKTTGEIKSVHEDYEDPKIFKSKSSDMTVQPDISFRLNDGRKHFTDISLKTEKPQNLVTRWKLLSTMATLSRGKLYLLAPRGHKIFTTRLVERYNINVTVQAL